MCYEWDFKSLSSFYFVYSLDYSWSLSFIPVAELTDLIYSIFQQKKKYYIVLASKSDPAFDDFLNVPTTIRVGGCSLLVQFYNTHPLQGQ